MRPYRSKNTNIPVVTFYPQPYTFTPLEQPHRHSSCDKIGSIVSNDYYYENQPHQERNIYETGRAYPERSAKSLFLCKTDSTPDIGFGSREDFDVPFTNAIITVNAASPNPSLIELNSNPYGSTGDNHLLDVPHSSNMFGGSGTSSTSTSGVVGSTVSSGIFSTCAGNAKASFPDDEGNRRSFPEASFSASSYPPSINSPEEKPFTDRERSVSENMFDPDNYLHDFHVYEQPSSYHKDLDDEIYLTRPTSGRKPKKISTDNTSSNKSIDNKDESICLEVFTTNEESQDLISTPPPSSGGTTDDERKLSISSDCPSQLSENSFLLREPRQKQISLL